MPPTTRNRRPPPAPARTAACSLALRVPPAALRPSDAQKCSASSVRRARPTTSIGKTRTPVSSHSTAPRRGGQRTTRSWAIASAQHLARSSPVNRLRVLGTSPTSTASKSSSRRTTTDRRAGRLRRAARAARNRPEARAAPRAAPRIPDSTSRDRSLPAPGAHHGPCPRFVRHEKCELAPRIDRLKLPTWKLKKSTEAVFSITYSS